MRMTTLFATLYHKGYVIMSQIPTPTYAQQYLPLITDVQEEYLARLSALVNIDSGTGQIAGVTQVIELLQQWLETMDFAVELCSVEGFGPNLIARRQGRGHTRLLLVGHVDTVYPAGAAEKQPFAIHDGYAVGPGVLDMKSGVLLAIYAVRTLIESGFTDYGELILFFNNDEEVGSPGSAPIIRDLAKQVDYALVLEPAGKLTSLTNARKGTDKYVLEIRGVASHSGVEPYKGRSAVVELAHKILAIQNLHSLLPGVTFNVTSLSSTKPLNVVPDMATCHISVRSFSPQELERASVMLEQIASNRSVPETRAILTRNRGRIPYGPTPALSHMVQLAEEEGEVLGFHLQAQAKGGVSDANILMDAGVPVLDTLGPIGNGMHNLDNERMLVASIPLRGALVAGLIHKLCVEEQSGRID